MKQALRYYRWCFRIWFVTTFEGTFVNRLVVAFNVVFRGEVEGLTYPTGPTYPMKYNEKTEQFDRFYSWADIQRIAANWKTA